MAARKPLGITTVGDVTQFQTGDFVDIPYGGTGATTAAGALTALGALGYVPATASTSTTTGAIIVTGGAGISGNIFAGGTVNSAGVINGTLGTNSTSTSTGSFILSGTGGIGIGGNLWAGGTGNFAGVLNATSGTASSSTGTGSIVTNGGIGASGNLFAGGTGNFAGILNATSGTTSTSSTTGAVVVTGGVGLSGALFTGGSATAGGVLTANSGTASISTTTGSLVVNGGVGISGSTYIGGATILSNATTVTAAGTTQGTAFAIAADRVVIGTAAAGTGVILPTPVVGQSTTIINNGANAVNVFPATGGQINALGSNAAYSLAAGAGVVLIAQSTTGWSSVSAASSAAASIGITQVSTNATYYPTFVSSSSSGTQAVDVGTGLSFNPSTNNLSTTTFTGALSGNATTATTATNATNATNVATTSVSTNASFYPLFVGSTTNSNQAASLDSSYFFNPSTNVLSSGAFAASNTTASSSSTTGAITSAGGVGVTGNVFAGGTGNFAGILNANATTTSTGYASGALVVAGGVGIAGALNTNSTASIGGTLNMNGNQINNVATPVLSTDAANKGYVDGLAQGMNQKPTARLATATALPTNTYINGTSGVGATLTATANAALSIDSVAVIAGDVVLIKNEATAANNGLYTVTATGSAGAPYVLTRSVDMNSSSSFVGAFVPVDNVGATQANSLWLINYAATYTPGTTAVNFTQLNGATDLAQGNGITISGNTISAQLSARLTFTGTAIDLANAGTAVTAQFVKITTDQYGRTTATTAVGSSDITGALGYTPINKAGDTATGVINFNNNTQSTSTTTGTIVVTGGIGLSSNLYVGGYSVRSNATTVTAAGTNQGTATAIATQNTIVTTVAAGTGVVLPAVVQGYELLVTNSGANSLTVYPNGSNTINGGSSVQVPAGTTLDILGASGTTWTTVVGAASSNLNVTQVSANASYYPLFVGANTSGTQTVDVGTGLSFNPSTNNLSTTTFTGALSGNATTATTATNVAGGAAGSLHYQTAANTTAMLPIGTANYVLTSSGSAPQYVAQSTLTVGSAGSATNATNVATTLQTAGTFYPTFVSSNTTSGGQAEGVATALSFNAATGALSSTSFVGALSGNSTTATTAGTSTNVATTLVASGTFYPALFGTAGTSAGQASDVAAALSYNAATAALSTTTFVGALSGNATTATTATNVTGGAAGSLVYQTGVGATSTLPLGTTNYIVTAGGSAPQYVNPATLSVGGANYSSITLNNGSGATTVICTPVYSNATGTYAVANAGGSTTKNIVGFLQSTSVTNGTPGTIITNGLMTATTAQWDAINSGESGGLTPGATYFLSAAGGYITTVAPTVVGQWVVKVGTALSSTQLQVNLLLPVGL
jgi:hypothetical protein